MTPRSSSGASSERSSEKKSPPRPATTNHTITTNQRRFSTQASERAYPLVRPSSQPSIVVKTLPCFFSWRSSLLHIIGDRVRATKPETSTAPASASANSMNSRPRQRHRDDREADLLDALDRGGHAVHARLDVAVDVLEHDDRIVDHEAD